MRFSHNCTPERASANALSGPRDFLAPCERDLGADAALPSILRSIDGHMSEPESPMRKNTTQHSVQSGFTVIELLIVVAVISIVASIAVPNYFASRLSANEAAVIGTMRQISASQLMFRSTNANDLDGNGQSEFGYLGELSGIRGLRGSGIKMLPPILNPAFGHISTFGSTRRNGYFFRLFLPNAAGEGLAELPGNDADVDPALSSLYYTCVAWPSTYGRTGQRSFFVCQTGDILTTIDKRYSGEAAAPVCNAAMRGVGPNIITTHEVSGGSELGVDGNRWQPVQ